MSKKQEKCQMQGQCHLLCLVEDAMMLPRGLTGQDVNDLEGLNEVYREIADEIGFENTVAIFRLFHGTQISFPNRLFSKEYIHDAIRREYTGTNVPQLAQKYNYSERSIWRILKTDK